VRRLTAQVLALAARDLALQRSYGLSAALGLLSGVLALLSYHFVGRLVIGREPLLGGASYFGFVCTGLMLQLVVAAAVGALGSALAREAREGVLEAELAAGASPAAILTGALLTPVLLALVQSSLYAAAGVALLDLDLGAARPGPALAALVATLLACAPIGLVGAAVWLRTARAGLVTTAALFLFGFLGGVYFPTAILPAPLADAAGWIPLALGLTALRGALLAGAGWTETAPELARLALLAVLGLPPAVLLLRASLTRALRRGTLAQV
jgi:ABC-2 type transport system permease protein